MRFWDSSALVPLLSDEPSTDAVYGLFGEDPDTIVACITPVEVTSAITRQAGFNLDLLSLAERRYSVLDTTWRIVDDYVRVLEVAREVVFRHRLRSGDAIQLASALIASRNEPSTLPFVTTDLELAAAARAEGFHTLP